MKPWRASKSNSAIYPSTIIDSINGMSVLHLAAVLGYSRLVSALLLWRTENPNRILNAEIDALGQDDEGFTPLVITKA